MHHSLSPKTMIFLLGVVLCIGVVLTLAVCVLQRALGRKMEPDKPQPLKIQPGDEAAFTLSAIKSVVTQLKADQNTLREQLAVAERNAEERSRKLELLVRETADGVIIFDAQGYVTLSNPQVRTLLAVDTWSRRRYPEIFQNHPTLAKLVGNCFENGIEVREKTVEIQMQDNDARQLQISALPTRDRMGALESVVCIVRQVNPMPPPA